MSIGDRRPGASHAHARERFSRPEVAARYPDAFRDDSPRDRRERSCIVRCLGDVPSGSHVLDLPCGTGRLTGLLAHRGYRVTAVDSSGPMARIARGRAAGGEGVPAPGRVSVVVADVMAMAFPDATFDAVVCNRLFHHFTEADTRRRALSELRRVCRGPIIVSFFNTFALDALYRAMRNRLRGVTPTDRVPIPMRALEADLSAVGLGITRRAATRWGISPHWYVTVLASST